MTVVDDRAVRFIAAPEPFETRPEPMEVRPEPIEADLDSLGSGRQLVQTGFEPIQAGPEPFPVTPESLAMAAEGADEPRPMMSRRTLRAVTGTRIAVISGDARIGGLVAKLLADALEQEDVGGALVLDAGVDVGAPAWRTAVGGADRLVLAVDAVGNGPAKAAKLLDRTGVRKATTVVMLPPARRGLSRGHEDIGAIRAHFEERTGIVLFVPNDPQPTIASLAAWRRIVNELS